jgi:hypothetical protein
MRGSILVRNEDLERSNEIGQRRALVTLPLVQLGDIVNEDDEVVLLALEVDLGLVCFSASHVDVFVCSGVLVEDLRMIIFEIFEDEFILTSALYLGLGLGFDVCQERIGGDSSRFCSICS